MVQAVRGRPLEMANAALTKLSASLLNWLEKVAMRDPKVGGWMGCTLDAGRRGRRRREERGGAHSFHFILSTRVSACVCVW